MSRRWRTLATARTPAAGRNRRPQPFDPSERTVQEAVLRYLSLDRRVAWAHRFNVGAHLVDEAAAAKARLLDRYAPRLAVLRHGAVPPLLGLLARLLTAHRALARRRSRLIRYAFPGCADVLGQLTDGRLLAVEVKTRRGRPTPDQRAFLATVERHRGVAVLARSVDDVRAALNLACGADAGRRPRALPNDPAREVAI